jgi:hypothetical protein
VAGGFSAGLGTELIDAEYFLFVTVSLKQVRCPWRTPAVKLASKCLVGLWLAKGLLVGRICFERAVKFCSLREFQGYYYLLQ